MKTSWFVFGVIVGLEFAGVHRAGAASFTALGDLPGGIFASVARGVSDDGSVVVGYSRTSTDQEAFRWTRTGGMVGLGSLDGGSTYSVAFGVSADGAVVIGQSISDLGPEAMRWTADGGMVGLGDLPGGFFSSTALGVSADGSVVVGSAVSDSGSEAFRWTAANEMVGLGDLPGGVFISDASAVSADGTVVVGYGISAAGAEAFRWTAAGGGVGQPAEMIGLGDLPDSIFLSASGGVSPEGAVIVGIGTGDAGKEGFRWTEEGGMVGLGDLPGGSYWSNANGTSADGLIVVGASLSNVSEEAYIWDAAHGMRNLRTVLIDDFGLGAQLEGWTLRGAMGISPDGLSIVGYGKNPSGDGEAWLAVVPEPTTATLLVIAMAGIVIARRRTERVR